MGKLRHAGPLFAEFVRFARAHKAYWIVPLLLVLGLVAALVFVTQGATPFLYTLF